MSQSINVIKRSGEKQPLDLDRFHKVVAYACDGITGVSASEIELKSHLQFYNNIKTSDIQETLIKASADLISEDTPNYQFAAGRLINYHLRKEAYGSFEPPHLFDHIKKLIDLRLYDKELLKMYSHAEWNKINRMINHKRDETIPYAGMEQFRGKYLVRDRTTNQFYETPQMAYILIAAVLFAKYPKETRLDWVADFYDAISQHEISVATPILSGIRTPQRQFSSCTLIECGDSLNSIIATSGAIKKYVSARAGIGIGSQIRCLDDIVKNGMVSHTGKIPYWKGWQADVGSCSQGGVRKGSATINEALFDLEIEDLLVLKNNKGTEETSIRHMDYCFHLNKLFLERYINGEKITLFSRGSAKHVFDAFYRNDPNFKDIYEKAERSHILRKKVVDAQDLIDKLLEERFNTGRIYLMFIDHANDHGSFIPELAPIKMTNLCVEVTLPTKELNDLNDPTGEIALCTLLAINWGKVLEPDQFERLARLCVRALNCLIDFQDYEVPAARTATMARRPIGVGIMNLAYFFAKNDCTYSNPNLELLHRYVEAQMYYLIKASMELAKEQPELVPSKFNETKYARGILPIDTYKKEVDELVANDLHYDWETLRIDVIKYHMANSTVAAGMPGETSSQVLNATSGIDPVRGIVTTKQSRDGVMKQVVPEPRKLKNKYEILWDIDCKGMIKVGAVIQKFFDQSLSLNTTYNPAHYENEEISVDVLFEDVAYAYKYGIKTLYYNNTAPTKADPSEEPETQPELVVYDEETCDGCTL
jgi:ribonucleoside-diphosphate reductase alpha chain